VTDEIRRRDLAKIHIAKKELDLDDAVYRGIIAIEGGAPSGSAADLDGPGRMRVLRLLRRLGWRPGLPRQVRDNGESAQDRLILALWGGLYRMGAIRHGDRRALNGWVRRMTGVDDLTLCRPAQKQHLIEELKRWQARIEAKNRGG